MSSGLRLGLRLAFAGGREALVRLAFTMTGVAIGVTLVLLALAGPPAAAARVDRTTWQHAGSALLNDDPADDPPIEAPDGALFLVVSDNYDGVPIVRAYVAALGAHPPVPRGLDRLPRPGEIALSPAMRSLLESTSDGLLGDRFPGRAALTIGPDGLAHDGELVAIIGRTPDQLRGVGSVREVRGFYRSGVPMSWVIYFQAGAMAVGTVLVVVPVALLIIVVARVAWRQRERRLAAIRLVGATTPQIALIAAAETGLAAVAGTALGWGGYELGRRVAAATLVFQGGHFWLADLAPPSLALAIVLAGTPLLVVATTIASLRHVRARPLSVYSGASGRAPSPWTVVPLAVGVGGQFAVVPFRDRLAEEGGTLTLLVVGLTIATLVGFVLFGPWVVMAVGRGIARLSRGVPALLAARRIAADPYATFRGISAVVLAALALTYTGSTVTQRTPPDVSSYPHLRPGVVAVETGVVPATAVAPLLELDGAVPIRTDGGPGIVPCAELARVRDRITCPHSPLEDSWLLEPGPLTGTGGFVLTVYIPTDGSLSAENRVRNQVAALVPNALVNSARAPVAWDFSEYFRDFDRLLRVVAAFVLIIGAFGLVAAMIGGLIERRRAFALLRATGVGTDELRRSVLLETTATMAIASVVGAGLGLVLAFASALQSNVDWRWPGPEVYGSFAAGVLAALLFSTIALPLLGRTTRHDAVRFE